MSTIDCGKTNAPLFLGMEFGIKSLPGFLFLILGTVRYCSIKHMAIASVFYSKMFKTKFGLSAFMAVITFAYMLTVFLTPKDSVASSWINQCDKQNYAIIYLIQCAAWSLGTFLLVKEYQRLQDEAYYANYLFWAGNLVCESIVIVVLRKTILASLFMSLTALFNLTVNTVLIVLALKTTRHNTRYRSPLIIDYPEYKQPDLFEQGPLTWKVRFQEKAILLNNQNYY